MLLQTESEDKSNPPKCWKKYLPGLDALETVPKNLWKPDWDDFEICKYVILSNMFICVLSLASGSLFGPLAYWDGPMYVYVARTLYNIPYSGPDSHLFKRPPHYFACHLPGYPLLIRILSMICFKQYWLGELLSIFVGAILVTYVFRRLLIVYDCVQDPVFTTKISLIIPLRFCLYKGVGASEPLYISYCYLALIFFKTDQLILMLLSIWGACITRIEGLSIVGTIGLCYLLKLDIFRAAFTGLGFLATTGIAYLHHVKFGNYKAYIDYNSGVQELIKYPFHHLFDIFQLEQQPFKSHLLMYLFVPFLAGTLLLFTISVPFGIFSTVYIIYYSSLEHQDLARYCLPGFLLAILIGFDSIIGSAIFKTRLEIMRIPVFFIAALYFVTNLGSNRAEDKFFMKICDIIHHVYNGTDVIPRNYVYS